MLYLLFLVEQVPCIPHNCSSHARFINGQCVCDPGWKGELCDEGLFLDTYVGMNISCIDINNISFVFKGKLELILSPW